MISIARSGILRATDFEKGINLRNSKSRYNICLTRTHSNVEGVGTLFKDKETPVLLTIDTDYINAKQKPFDWTYSSDSGDKERRINGRKLQERGTNQFYNQQEQRVFPINPNVNISRALQRIEIILNWRTYDDDKDNKQHDFESVMSDFLDEIYDGDDPLRLVGSYYSLLYVSTRFMNRITEFVELLTSCQKGFDVPIYVYKDNNDFFMKKPCDFHEFIGKFMKSIKYAISYEKQIRQVEATGGGSYSPIAHYIYQIKQSYNNIQNAISKSFYY